MQAELRERTLGEMLGVSFSLAAERFGPLFVVLLVCNLPPLVVQLTLLPDPSHLALGAADPQVFFAWFNRYMEGIGVLAGVSMVTYPLQEGACALVAALPFLGERRSLRWVLGQALRRYPGLLLLLLALSLLFTAGICPGMFVGYLLFQAWFYVAVPALMLEKIGWAEALQRSRALTAGHTLEVLAVFAVTRFGMGFILGPFVLLIGVVLQQYYYANVVAQYFASLVAVTVPAVAPVVVYYHLRVTKEHYDIQRLAELVPVIGARAAARDAGGA